MRGEENPEIAKVAAARLVEIRFEHQQNELANILKLAQGQGLSLEVLDMALKEIDRRYPDCGLGGYSLSMSLGYCFPLSEEELIRVLKPMAKESRPEA